MFLLLGFYDLPVLKPNFDLSFCEIERECEVEPFADGQVASRLELVLQRHQLLVRERSPGTPGFGRFRVARTFLSGSIKNK